MCFCSSRLDNLYINAEKKLLYEALFAEQQPNGGYKFINIDKATIKPLLNNEVISCVNKYVDKKTNEPSSKNSTYKNSNNNIFEVLHNQTRKLHFDIDIANKHSLNKNDKECLDDKALLDIIHAIKNTLRNRCGITDDVKLECLVYNKMTQTYYKNISQAEFIGIKSVHLVFPYLSIDYISNKKLADDLNNKNETLIALNINQHNKKPNHKLLDEAIYTKNRNFCLPFNTKYGENEYFYPYFECDTNTLALYDYNKYLINNTENTTLITYQQENTPLEAKRIRKTLFSDEELKKSLKYIQVKPTDNLIDLLIKHLPIELYGSKLRWSLLCRYLFMNGFSDDEVLRFMNHSAITTKQSYSQEQITTEIEKLKTASYLCNYGAVMEHIAINEKVFFLVSKIKPEVMEWIYKKTDTDLNDDSLSKSIIKAELNAMEKQAKMSYEHKHYTIEFYKAIIKDTTNNRLYNYTYDTTTTINDYSKEAKKSLEILYTKNGLLEYDYEKNKPNSTDGLLSMEQIKSVILDIYKEKDKNIYEPKTFVAVKAKWGSGKTKHIVNSSIQYLIDKEISEQDCDSDDERLSEAVSEPHTQLRFNNGENSVVCGQNHIEDSNIKILMITNSNNLNTENITKLRKSYPSLIIVSHLDKADFKHDKINILVCSLDSIYKTENNNSYAYDMVILDEYESIMSYMTENENFEKQANTTAEKVYETFCFIIKEAKKIIALDADLCVRKLDIIKRITDISPICFNSNANNFKNYKYKYHYNLDKFETILKDGLQANKKIVIASSTKKSLETAKHILDTQYQDKKYALMTNCGMIISNFMKISKADFIKTIETQIQKLDVFLYSPTITIGVSIETKYFHILLCIPYNNEAPNARVFIQMIYRVRHLIDNCVHIFPHKYLVYTPLNNRLYENEVQQNYSNDIKEYYNINCNSKVDETYKLLVSYNKTEKNYSKYHYNEEFVMKTKQHDLDMEFLYQTEKNEYERLDKEAKEELIYNITQMPLISYEENEAIKAKETKDYEDGLTQQKYYITKNVPSRIFDVIADREYYDDTRQYQEIHEKNNSVFKKEFIENKTTITKTLIKHQDNMKNVEYYNTEPLVKVNCSNSELKISKHTEHKLVIQYILKILDILGINKFNNFYRQFSKDELDSIILDNKAFITTKFGDYVANITETRPKKIYSQEDKNIIKYFIDGLYKISQIDITNKLYKRSFDAFFNTGYENKSVKSYYKTKDGKSLQKYRITITLKNNCFKYSWLNNNVVLNNDDCLKFVKINNKKADGRYNMYINGIFNEQVLITSETKKSRDIDGLENHTIKKYENSILDTRQITYWDIDLIKKVVDKKTKKTEFVFNDEAPSKKIKLVCSNRDFVRLDTYTDYSKIKPHFIQTCNVELQSIYGLLYFSPIAINQYNYDFDKCVNSLATNIRLNTIMTKKYHNATLIRTQEYNNIIKQLKISENDYDNYNNIYADKCNGVINYYRHKKVVEKSSIIKTNLIKDLVWEIVNNSISVVCNEPIQVIEHIPTGIKLKPNFYYSELVANVSNTIKHIFNVVNSKSPIGFNGLIRNGNMLNDYSSITRGDKLVLCYDFKKANGLFEVSLIVL